MMIDTLIRRGMPLTDLDPVIAQRLTQEAQARHAVRVFESTAPAPKPAPAPGAVRVFRDDSERFAFTAAVFPCTARYGRSIAPQLLKFVIDTGASATHVPVGALGGVGSPAGADRLADGSIARTTSARMHLWTGRDQPLTTFDGLAFADRGDCDALLGMDLLASFDFNDQFNAHVTLRSQEVKLCSCD